VPGTFFLAKEISYAVNERWNSDAHRDRRVSGTRSYGFLLTRSTDDGLTLGPSGGTTLLSSLSPSFAGPGRPLGRTRGIFWIFS
jgi:hypothetical protein